MEYIYSILQILGDGISSVVVFILNIPHYIEQLFIYLGLLLFDIWLDTKIYTLNLALTIARELLSNYGVYDLIEIAFNRLSPDVRYVLTAYGFPDGLRMLFDAYATAFVLRVLGW
ncbi:hypothetical protein BIT28_10740 [Photobacterium proteolyticum]|uniref:DUF2523 domain-containing protein n=1 Tax=Photobacterium proteolyticum TaxID=1903952 RepID=A0A1Q9G6R1_9GAMM|nr:DUF2523 family protein [Photobacterium proteolyticum]OLQ70013.1 hypothetical protein BIT28_10740 [Photobacterium proteolyticum]